VKKSNFVLSAVCILLLILVSIQVLPYPLFSFHQSTSTEPIQGWEYQWGQETLSKNMPWQKWDFQQGHLERNPRYKYIWLKAELPQEGYQNPVIYFYGILADSLHVYLDKELIYQSQETDTILGNQVIRKIIMPLPNEWQGKTIFLRLEATSNQYIGIYGTVLLGPHKNILEQIFKHEFDHILLGSFFLTLASIMWAVSIFVRDKQQKKALFALIFFTICTGGWNIAEYDNVDLLFFYSPLWPYLDGISVLMTPIAGFYFFEQVFGSGPGKIIRRIWQFHLLYVIPYLVLVTLNNTIFNENVYTFLTTYYSWTYIKLLFILYSLILVLVVAGLVVKRDNLEIKIFAAGITFLALSIVCVDLDLANWGIFGLIVSLILILAHRFVENHDRLAAWSKNLEQTVAARTASLRNLLNNAGQGFLSFGEDLLVNEEYSEECLRIFGQDIEKKPILDLLFPEDEEEKNFLENVFRKIIHDREGSLREKYLPLLPNELKLKGQDIQIQYKIVNDIFMLIITDVTDKRFLERQVEKERNLLKMVVRCMLNRRDFHEYVNDYRNFYSSRLQQILAGECPLPELVNEIFRLVHTFKGSFSQLEMVKVVQHLHNLETDLADWQKNLRNIDLSSLKSYFQKLPWEEWLEEDLRILQSILGQDFFKRPEGIYIEKTKLLEIEEKILSSLQPPESEHLLKEIRKLSLKPFRELLDAYPEYIERLGEKLNKSIKPLQIQGGNTLVNPDKYLNFTKSLVNVFRNIVDHGLESSPERLERNKPEYGNIECRIQVQDEKLYLTIKDDGRGIKQEIVSLIFKAGFSTVDGVREISGRGMGLAAVKIELERIGGSVEVSTQEGIGTEFCFILPILE